MRKLFLAGTALVGLTGAAQADVTLGALYGMTGPIESFMPPIVAATELAVDQVNEQGGILGGQTLRLRIADSQCASQGAVDGASTLVNIEQVSAIVGGLCSGATIPAATSVAVPAGVPMISPASTSPEITALDDNDLVFRVVPSDAYQGEVLAAYVINSGIERVALTYVNNDYGVGLAGAFRDAFLARGGVITADQVHEPQKASYRAELATLAGAGPEALVLIAYAADSGATMIRQSLENGFFDTFIGADGLRDNTLVESIGAENLQNLLVTAPTSLPDDGGMSLFAEAFNAANEGMDSNSAFAAQSYDAAFLLALAIEQAGTTDPAAVAQAIRTVANPPGEPVGPGEWAKALELIAAGTDIDFNGASGPHDFDEDGDVAGVVGEFVIEGGVFVEKGLLQP